MRYDISCDIADAMHRTLRRKLRDLPWARSGRLFAPGEVRLALLSLLSDAPGHGYELMTRLGERCGGGYEPSAGVIYPTLQQLEDEGRIDATPVGGKRTFRLSATGERELEEHAAEVAALWRRMQARGEWGVLQDPEAAEIIGPALRLVKAAARAVLDARGDPDVVDTVRSVLDDARARIERHGRKH